ncbi:MAG: hypothetical protein NZ517_08540 [Candidatus Nitrosocaldus sp.]|nr:hypothetical protein [Candidatus Nitrosocaldus sp.]
MNKWRAVRVKEDLHMLLQQKAAKEDRSLANYLDSILRRILEVKQDGHD